MAQSTNANLMQANHNAIPGQPNCNAIPRTANLFYPRAPETYPTSGKASEANRGNTLQRAWMQHTKCGKNTAEQTSLPWLRFLYAAVVQVAKLARNDRTLIGDRLVSFTCLGCCDGEGGISRAGPKALQLVICTENQCFRIGGSEQRAPDGPLSLSIRPLPEPQLAPAGRHVPFNG